MIQKNNKVIIIIAAAVFLFIAVVIVVFYMASSKKSSTSDSITINNFSTYVKNLPSSEQEAIQKSLYNTVKLNTPNTQEIKAINDAVIRSSTYQQDIAKQIYTTTFIVDIESIKQSYEIKDLYSKLSVEDSGLYDYTALALCLGKDNLRYGEFICQDRLSQEAGVSRSDPVLQYLPVSTLDYTLSLDKSSKDIHLTAQLSLSEIDYTIGVDTAVAQYKAKIQKWFTSKKLDINNYSITYKY